MKSHEESENTSEISDLHEFDISEISREVYLEGEIDEKTLITLLKNINYLNSLSCQPIVIHACSPGGETYAGFGIYSAIKLSNSPIIFVGYGQISSMASVIMQAATKRLLAPLSYMMIHEGDIIVESENKKAYGWVKLYRNQLDTVYDIYCTRCKECEFFKDKPDQVIKSFLKKKITKLSDWYLYGEDAIKYGFADGFLGSKEYPSLESIRNQLISKIE